MLNGIDITKAKEYNENVKKYRNMANQLQTEIKFNKEQLAACCAELTQELGMEVNESNLREVLEAQETKITNIMNVGNSVISKIQADQNASSVQPVNQGQAPMTGMPGTVQQPAGVNNFVQNQQMMQTNTGINQTQGLNGVADMFAQQQVSNNQQVDLNNLQNMNQPFFKM